ncbi:MAG TPA: 7-cyano-7-deazaguanine synthase [Thermoplasmata archaeon]
MNRRRVVTPVRVSSRESDYARLDAFVSGRDIYRIGESAIAVENQVKAGYRKIESVIPVSMINLDRFRDNDITTDLEHLFEYLWPVEISVRFVAADTRVRTSKYEVSLTQKTEVSLFSGGIDSLATLLKRITEGRRPIALFVAHSDLGGLIHIVQSLYKSVLEQISVPLLTLYAPPLRRAGYSQTRGFLYGMAALAVAESLRRRSFVMGECGPTMHQPRFGPFDTTTMTSHPLVLEVIRSIAKKLTQNRIRLETPLAGHTKAEAMALIKDRGWLKLTHSCISQQFRSHDGTCYGCIIRRLASMALGIPDVHYRYDSIVSGRKGKDNLVSLLRFSYDMLTDFDALPEDVIEEIKKWKTRDLFERFALDNLAGFRIWIHAYPYTPPFADRILKAFPIGELNEALTERVAKVRTAHADTLSP